MVATWSDDESSNCNEESSTSDENEVCFMAGSTEEQEYPDFVMVVSTQPLMVSTLDRSDTQELAASTQFNVDDINETICLYKDNEQEEVDPNALEREVESDVEEESRHDEDEFEEDDEDDAELNISSASDDEYR
ncbi:hypothetical protein Taro_029532 [Colocasia esculenta]|uniref:Uncharacterized protein n=1 Tax=Colocasia esculenta TaxID=4460 RepID=A0A843VE19_COLES|nr:hypothetical protein [Colocasia esculenta]